MNNNGFQRRLSYGQKFESRLVEIFTEAGFESGLLEFETAVENATNGDLYVVTKTGRKLQLEAKYTCKVALKSIDRFQGSFYILTPHSFTESPTKITADKIYVIPKRAMVNYKNALAEDNKVFEMQSGDLGIELNLGQYITGFEFQKKVTLEKFIEDDLMVLL